MQKKIIALAIGGLLSGAAFAQSNVSIYGIIDQAFESANYGTGSQTRLQSSGMNTNRLGFQGSEDLGNGLKANFRLEMGGTPDTGAADAAGLFQREARVGLSGNFGSIDFGRQYTPLFNTQAAADVFYVAGIGSNYALTNTGMTRMSNSFRYTSPNFSGLTVTLGFSPGDSGAAFNPATGALATGGANQENTAAGLHSQGKHIGFNAIYSNGPLTGLLGYGKTTCIDDATVAGTACGFDVKATLVGGAYNFGAFKLVAGVETAKLDATPGGIAADFSGWLVSGVMPMGAHTFKASYTHLKNKMVANSNSALTALGYEYAMSKRTSLYGTWSRMNNDTAANASLAGSGMAVAGAGTNTVAAGYDPSGIQLGIKHSF